MSKEIATENVRIKKSTFRKLEYVKYLEKDIKTFDGIINKLMTLYHKERNKKKE